LTGKEGGKLDGVVEEEAEGSGSAGDVASPVILLPPMYETAEFARLIAGVL
jgi:hypothetical protein